MKVKLKLIKSKVISLKKLAGMFFENVAQKIGLKF